MTATPKSPRAFSPLFHLLPATAHLTWGTELRPQSLSSEGFVHLCTQSQLLPTAERWFSEQQDLLVLMLDPRHFKNDFRWEDLYGHGDLYPHLYGPIPGQAWLGVFKLSRDSQGSFSYPGPWDSPLSLAPTSEVGLIDPKHRFTEHQKLPENCLLCYFPWAWDVLLGRFPSRIENRPGSGVGPEAVTVVRTESREVAVCQPGFGGPAAAVCLEELIALGCRRFVLCGGAGALAPGLNLGQILLVTRALRDEGLSHHYLAATQDLRLESELIDRANDYFSAANCGVQTATVWSTDALYRETRSRIANRRLQGAEIVDMETSALLAVAQFRGVPLVPLLCCGDDLSGDEWDFRNWTSETAHHQRAVELAFSLLEHLAETGD